MGYTRYWYRPKELDAMKFKLLKNDIKAIIKNCDVKIVNSHGEDGPPLVTNERISFNGYGEDSHESFDLPRVLEGEGYTAHKACTSHEYIKKGLCLQFCKTQHKPYDAVVAASLLALKEIFPEIEISSDYGMEDFAEGSVLLSQARDNKKEKPIDTLYQLKNSIEFEKLKINELLNSAPPEFLPWFLKGVDVGYNEALKHIKILQDKYDTKN